jgi:hypothetical protein
VIGSFPDSAVLHPRYDDAARGFAQFQLDHHQIVRRQAMLQQHRFRSCGFALAVVVMLQGAVWSTPAAAARPVSYSLDVLPILQNHCVKCHQPDQPGHAASGLDLRSYDALMQGTKHGKIVVPGNPLTSTLMVLIDGRADSSIRMPHNEQPLLKQQVEIVRDWIKQGAKNN